MLTIRNEHMAALSGYMRKRFEDRMVEHIAADFPEQFGQMKEQGARKFVRTRVEHCAERGIDTERGIRFFVDLMLQNPDFDGSRDMAWARKILQDDELSGKAKMNLIQKRLESAKSRRQA